MIEQSNWMLFFNLLFGFIIGLVAAYYAERKGRNRLAWFLLGFFFSVFALIALYFLSSLKAEDVQKKEPSVSSPITPLSLSVPEHTQLPDPGLKNLGNEDRLWYYLDQNHQQYGPVSLVALKDLWNTGMLGLRSYVWSEGMEKWEHVENLPDLIHAFKSRMG